MDPYLETLTDHDLIVKQAFLRNSLAKKRANLAHAQKELDLVNDRISKIEAFIAAKSPHPNSQEEDEKSDEQNLMSF